MKRNTPLVLLPFLVAPLLAQTPVWFAKGNSNRYSNFMLEYDSRIEPAGPVTFQNGVYGIPTRGGAVIDRYFFDPQQKTYFGYRVSVTAIALAGATVLLEPLPLEAAAREIPAMANPADWTYSEPYRLGLNSK